MKKTKRIKRITRLLMAILANVGIVLSGVYITFHILDHFNPRFHFVMGSEFFLVEFLFLLIPILSICIAAFYQLLFREGIFRERKLSGKRVLKVFLIDFVFYGLLALAVCAYSFDWFHTSGAREDEIVQLATPTPAMEVVIPTDTPAPVTDAVDTVPPTETPEPTATPIPGLLGNKFAEKFTDGEPVIYEADENQVGETLEDGTVRTLLYSYASDVVCVDVYHYQQGRLEYQIADIYCRDVTCLQANYVLNDNDSKRTAVYAREIDALVAVNGDNFTDGDTREGLIIRNGSLIRNLEKYTADLCVIYYDGTMRCYDYRNDVFTTEEILNNYPYQAYYFGPKLLNEDGTAKTTFNSTLGKENPRTAIGYYEPGHYALLSILGTRDMIDINGRHLGAGKSPGMTFKELSALCEKMGYAMAYNLDGGGSSSMYYNETIFGHNDRSHADVLGVADINH